MKAKTTAKRAKPATKRDNGVDDKFGIDDDVDLAAEEPDERDEGVSEPHLLIDDRDEAPSEFHPMSAKEKAAVKSAGPEEPPEEEEQVLSFKPRKRMTSQGPVYDPLAEYRTSTIYEVRVTREGHKDPKQQNCEQGECGRIRVVPGGPSATDQIAQKWQGGNYLLHVKGCRPLPVEIPGEPAPITGEARGEYFREKDEARRRREEEEEYGDLVDELDTPGYPGSLAAGAAMEQGRFTSHQGPRYPRRYPTYPIHPGYDRSLYESLPPPGEVEDVRRDLASFKQEVTASVKEVVGSLEHKLTQNSMMGDVMKMMMHSAQEEEKRHTRALERREQERREEEERRRREDERKDRERAEQQHRRDDDRKDREKLEQQRRDEELKRWEREREREREDRKERETRESKFQEMQLNLMAGARKESAGVFDFMEKAVQTLGGLKELANPAPSEEAAKYDFWKGMVETGAGPAAAILGQFVKPGQQSQQQAHPGVPPGHALVMLPDGRTAVIPEAALNHIPPEALAPQQPAQHAPPAQQPRVRLQPVPAMQPSQAAPMPLPPEAPAERAPVSRRLIAILATATELMGSGGDPAGFALALAEADKPERVRSNPDIVGFMRGFASSEVMTSMVRSYSSTPPDLEPYRDAFLKAALTEGGRTWLDSFLSALKAIDLG